MSKRSVIGLVYMLQGAKMLGVDPAPILAKHGLYLEQLNPAAEIDREQEMAILHEVSSLFDNPLAGLQIGESISTAGYGVFTMLLMTCDNAQQALMMGVAYQQLAYLHGQLSLDFLPDMTSLIIDPVPMPASTRRILIDGDLAGTVKLLRDLQAQFGVLGVAKAVEVWVPYPKPKEYRAYESYYQCPVRFDCQQARIILPSAILQIPFLTANKTANLLYKQQCDALLAQRFQGEGLTGRVLGYLDLVTRYYPTADEVATIMGMTGRSFRRQLAVEQTTFRQLLDKARYQKAAHYLQNAQFSVDYIAEQLGYSESAAFIHAFQRWTGKSPSTFRKVNF